jgi:hypothetical protein
MFKTPGSSLASKKRREGDGREEGCTIKWINPEKTD